MKGSQLNARTTLSAHHRGLSKEPGLKSIFRHLVTSSLSHNTFLNNFFSWIYKKSQRKHSLTAWKSISAQTKELLEILRKLGKRSVTSKKTVCNKWTASERNRKTIQQRAETRAERRSGPSADRLLFSGVSAEMVSVKDGCQEAVLNEGRGMKLDWRPEEPVWWRDGSTVSRRSAVGVCSHLWTRWRLCHVWLFNRWCWRSFETAGITNTDDTIRFIRKASDW